MKTYEFEGDLTIRCSNVKARVIANNKEEAKDKLFEGDFEVVDLYGTVAGANDLDFDADDEPKVI